MLKILALLAVMIVAGALLTDFVSRPGCTFLQGAATLKIKLDRHAPGEFFCYKDRAGEKLRFLLTEDPSGKVYTVFDACRQCYKFHKGYTYARGYLICRLCGNRYRIETARVGRASCAPVALASKRAGDQVTVKVTDVKAGKWLF